MDRKYILGGGVTGLAAGLTSGLPIFEAADEPGGICCSYYVRPGERERLVRAPADEEAYRFEIGGGHWIFGGDPTVLQFIRTIAPVNTYQRRSAVYFCAQDLYVPYPLQNHLRYLGNETVRQVLKELVDQPGEFHTMEEWMAENFGPTLCRLFFYPFHDLYTAGLHKRIAPQDAYKSPVSLSHVIQGAFEEAPSVGYNVNFVYPHEGLNMLAQRMANLCDIRYGKRVVEVDVKNKEVCFADGSSMAYDKLLSTLPLNKMMQMANLQAELAPDPHTSVLVLNIGAVRGERCPDEHWLYNPDTKSGFHRVGFYSNVDRSFLPKSARPNNAGVSIYVERAYVDGDKPTETEVAHYAENVVQELKAWGYIEEAEVVDPTWIDVAYTWSYPNSRWKEQALQKLEANGIYQIGRYGRWNFQGIADSVRDGFYAGASFKTLEAERKIIHLGNAQQRQRAIVEKVADKKVADKKVVDKKVVDKKVVDKVVANGTTGEAGRPRETATLGNSESLKPKS
ncbi:MAG: FAD-dependent oxidoreductase [Caldilineaceae bacterium]